MDMFSSTESAKNAVDMFPQTAQTRKGLWICSHKQKNSKDIQPIVSSHVETVVCLLREKVDGHINITVNVDELGEISYTPIPDTKSKESNYPKATRSKTFGHATYSEIKDYVLYKYKFKVSSLYIAQTKEKYGITERKNYYLPQSPDSRKPPQCPPEKEAAIVDALRHFHMIPADR